MNRQLPFFTYGSPLQYKKSARLTNSVNALGLRTFNNWGGINYQEILSNYPTEIKEKCWLNLSRCIIENYHSGKGTFIKGFGTFTFTNVEYNLEGTTNQYNRDIKPRYPVFLVSNEFVDYLKPGIFTEKSGLIYYTQKLNNKVPIIKLNLAKISYGANISKEECFTILSSTIKLMADQIRRKVYNNNKSLPDLGLFINRGNIFGVRFDYNLIDNVPLQTQKLIHTKKNLRFYMETKDSEGIPHKDIEDIDKAERDLRPRTAVLTTITPSADGWLKGNMGIDVQNDIKDLPRDDINLKKVIKKNEYLVDQRYFRNFPVQNLLGLNISQDILEGILNNRYILLRGMKQIDRHGDGLIPKYDFINSFFRTNVHHNLRIELIEKITNVYIGNNPEIIMVNYNNIINALCKDIKRIIENEYYHFPIEKYKNTIPKNNKRANSAYAFSLDSGNLENKAISSLHRYQKLPQINSNDVMDDIYKIAKVIYYIKNNPKNIIISYLSLINQLQSYQISINKVQMIKILKFLEIQNPNAFNINELITKINKHIDQRFINDSFRNKNSFRAKSTFDPNKRYKTTINNLSNLNSNNVSQQNNLRSANNTLNNNENNDTNKYPSNFESDIKVITKIRERIYTYGIELDEISRYFDHLLAYNICRKENVFFPDEFERLMQLEKYDFTIPEIYSAFNYLDTKKDGILDRIEFIQILKNVPHPITTIHNYIKNNRLTIDDIAYKMEFDIYNCPLEDTLNIKVDRLYFQTKMKLLNPKFDSDFIQSLFFSITQGKTETNVNHIFEVFNILKDDSYKDLFYNKDEFESQCFDIIPKCVSFREAKNTFLKMDKFITGKIPLDKFLTQIKIYLKNKLKEKILIHFCRIHKYINGKNEIHYQKFLSYVFKDTRDDIWKKCLDEFMKFLHTECSDDLFIFFVKINNMSNNSNIKRTLTNDRFFEFFRGRVDMVQMDMMSKFDFDEDGVISMDDLKNIILTYVDGHFFDDQKKINQDKLMKINRQKYEENKKFYLVIKEALTKINMTEDNLFYYLDKNKDGYIDINEFYTQISKLPLSKKYTKNQIDLFYTFFDEYNNGKVDINIFKNKILIFKDDMRNNQENGYMGNSTIENLILTEIAKYYQNNEHLCDTEFFSILDSDNDGKISIRDMKIFAIKTLLISPNELDDNKVLRFIEAISLTKTNNLVLADIQNLMQCILSNNLQIFRNNIYHFCNEGITKSNPDPEWINDVINKIGMFIDEHYNGNIKQLYDEYNLTAFRNKNQGLSFENFVNFVEANYLLFQSYHINQSEQRVLFNFISNKKKFITLDDLNRLFTRKKINTKNKTINTINKNKLEEEKGSDIQNSNNNNNDNNINYDFYGQMHNDILIFLHENFPTCEDAFKYFHAVKMAKGDETPTTNDNISNKNYLTKKEFFDGISKMFPDKYSTNTILNYYIKTFKKKDENDTIKFSEFNYIYYNNFKFDTQFDKSLGKDSKISTTRPIVNDIPFTTFNSPFPTKEHKKLETPYDLDPLEKIKRLILTSKIDFVSVFKRYINESGNGMANQFEFRNMIKRLDLGLTNIEIEDIINKSGLTSDGYINLVDFYKYITGENKNLVISKMNIMQILKELKQLIYKYYSNPRLAFELNDNEIQGTMDFDKFKKIVHDVYTREAKPTLTYPVLKYIYDYIDVRKDGVIDLNEWSKVFATSEGKLDYEQVKPEKMKILREWETSREIIEIYKLIARNKKLIRDKVRLFTVGSNVMLINASNLIDILKNVLGKLRLSQTQWKMIVSLGDKDKSGLIDFDAFIKIVEATSKMERSHPVKK